MKKLISIILAVIAILSISATAFAAPPADIISIDEAKAIAIEHSGYAENEVKLTKAKLDFDDGRYKYEIDFTVDRFEEYDYEIDAVTGKIIDYDYDYEGPGRFEGFSIIRIILNLIAKLFG